ncbi:zinc ribbon domain-containing protein [Azospirillum sp. B4]|uniref:zinc ribbon domain-containing protein n=1 Tax=Azospirillum sp. B4 TaxID=95605 RepID=UPI0003495B72|nr:zinc ribbon domain-containing protein [Azospirillum sp. B4]
MADCWACGKPVSGRALFCHNCGAIQPPADLDAFARLNLERRFDVERAVLDRQRAGFARILDPERLKSRGAQEKALAERYRQAVEQAYVTLRDPAARARYLLDLVRPEGELPGTPGKGPEDADMADLAAQVAALHAANPVDEDQLEQATLGVIGAIAGTLVDLSAAFHKGNLAAVPALAERLGLCQQLGEALGAVTPPDVDD